MGVAFQRGQQLGSNDLFVLIRSLIGVITDPFRIRYDIYRRTETGLDILVLQDQVPSKERIGYYFVAMKVPEGWAAGEHFISWKITDVQGAPAISKEERFSVEDLCVQVGGPVLTAMEKSLLSKLRNVLRDNNPDRNYRFRPPKPKKDVKNFTSQFGLIWEDHELVDFLHLALDWVNLYPPSTTVSVDGLDHPRFRPWRIMVITGAAVLALEAVTLNWIADEFGYSISGIQLDLEKSSKYMAMKDSLEQQLVNMIEKAKSAIKVTKGLSQTRWSVGMQGAFLGPYTSPGSLSIRNMLGGLYY